MPAIWQIPELRPIHHRIIWWFVDAGAVGKTLARGWQKQCAEDLKIHRLTLRANVIKMTQMGVLVNGEKRGEIQLKAVIFAKMVDRSKIKVKEG